MRRRRSWNDHDEIVSKRTLNAEVKDTVKKLGLRMLKRLQVFRLMGAGVRAVSAYSIAGRSAR